MLKSDIDKANYIYNKYYNYYDGEIQGCCLLIVDEINRLIGGEIVAGYLCWSGCQRSHWWIEKDGEIIDRMGFDLLSHEFNGRHEEIHRNKNIFNELLPKYEQWRVF